MLAESTEFVNVEYECRFSKRRERDSFSVCVSHCCGELNYSLEYIIKM